MEKLRQMILSQMTDELSKNQLEQLAQVLDVSFHEFEIEEKSRELTVLDNKDVLLIKNFLGSKVLGGCSERTVEHYGFTIQCMIDDIQKPLTEITTNDIRYHMASWKTKNNCSNVTMNNKRAVYCSLFKWLRLDGYITDDPMERIKPFKEKKKDVKPFTSRELQKLFNGCTTTRDRALFEFLYSTGARVSECVEVRLSDIDFKEGTLLIRHGKGDKERTVYISDSAMYWLEKYLAERNTNDDILWVGKRGQLSKNGIESVVRKVGLAVGVEAHPHRFRHTLATDMIRRGAPVQVVQQILGHEDISTTMIYVEIAQSDVANAHKKLVA